MEKGVKNLQALAYNGAHTVFGKLGDNKLGKFDTFSPVCRPAGHRWNMGQWSPFTQEKH